MSRLHRTTGPADARRRRRDRVAGVVALVSLLLAGCVTRLASPTDTLPSTEAGPSTLGPDPLGVNVAAWDSLYAGSATTRVDGLIAGAGLRQLRYPGGSTADNYHWTSTSRLDPLTFDRLETAAHQAGASIFVTVNYGSGTPGEAAAWIAHATSRRDPAVTLWEVGNESYSCYETNHHLAGSPTFVRHYRPGRSACPATGEMARSYAANALPYLRAMDRADPTARIGVPWALSGAVAGGAGVTDPDTWNDVVLRGLRSRVGFVDVHWYPFNTLQGVSEQQIMDSVQRIPSVARHIRSTLGRYAPKATFTVGEANISERPTTADFDPVAALFAAATSLEWLSAGAGSVDWWDLHNNGSPAGGDFGLLSSGAGEDEPAQTPFPPYYGELMAAMLARPGSHLRSFTTATPSVFGFESDLAGQRSVLLINDDASRASTVSPTWFRPGLQLVVNTYSPATANGATPIRGSSAASTVNVPLPPESIVVLSGTPSS